MLPAVAVSGGDRFVGFHGPVPVRDDDSVDSLHERIKSSERGMLVEWVGRLARDGHSIDGRRVVTPAQPKDIR